MTGTFKSADGKRDIPCQSEEMVRAFCLRHGVDIEMKCRRCSTTVKHKAIGFEKTKDHAIIHHDKCPDGEGSGATFIPLSKKEREKWNDIYWGLIGKLDGYDPEFRTPPIETHLTEDDFLYFGPDEPYAVMYPGVCDMKTLLAVANIGWHDPKHPEEDPYTEASARYVYAREKPDGQWDLNISPRNEGARLVTLVWWDESEITKQGWVEPQTTSPRTGKKKTPDDNPHLKSV